jgi:hypothetical protein
MRRVLSVATFIIAAAMASLNAASATAQVVCGKRAEVLAGFAKAYHEVQSAIGIADSGGLIEVLVSPSGTWTMVVTKPGGLTCIIGSGRDWNTRPVVGTERIT